MSNGVKSSRTCRRTCVARIAPTSTFLFGGIVGRRFAADDGARAIGADADVGFAWPGGGDGGRGRPSAARYGVIGNDRQILQHRQWDAVELPGRRRLLSF